MGAKNAVSFRITGFLNELPVTASWRDGYLVADEELVDVANALVDSGYVFVTSGTDREVAAGLSDPFAALLTVIRSFGRITRAKIELPVDHDWHQLFDGEGNALWFRIDGQAGSAGDLDDGSADISTTQEA